MNRLKSGTFCVLPFIHEFRDCNGTQKLCCHSEQSIDLDSLIEIQRKISNGESVPHCQRCYDQESKKTISPRLRETARWLRDPDVTKYLEQWQVDGKLKTFSYDLRFDNKCNLACISCGPTSSSLWAKELGIDIIPNAIECDIDSLIKSKAVYLAGGEPLIIDQFNQLLTAVAKQDIQPEIVINTNLTRVNDTIAATLKQIKNLTLTISIDGFGKVNEYHRWPLSWDKFLRNLEWAASIGCTIQFNSVVDAVSVWGISQLVELEHLANFWSLTYLTSPKALRIENLPNHLKSLAIEEFEKIKNSRFYSKDIVFRKQVDAVINNITQPGSPELLSMYIDQIDQRRQINHVDYLGTKLT